MDATAQLKGLDRFLTSIYGEETHLASMIDALGFEPEQARMLHEDCLPDVMGQFLEVIRKKLTSGEKDQWFRILNRRFGLDGEPALSMEEAARILEIDALSASQAEADALHKCRFKATLSGFEKELHRIALAELSSSGDHPPKEQIARKLKRLADLHAAVDLAQMDYDNKRNEILKAVQAELDALEEEYQPLLDAAQENVTTLEGEIKNDVLLGGETVTTDVYQAVYMHGRIGWDNDGINNYARTHPEILKYRKEGRPTVSIRTVGKGE